MTAKDQLGKLLDQLMGQNRDGDDNNKEKHFTDREVCRPFLLGICINDLFINTREEMGECLKIHSITLKEEYEGASENRDYHYDEEVLDYLRSFIKDNERKIEINKKRIDSAEDDPVLAKLGQEIHEVAVEIGEKVAKAESLGAEGDVDESMAMLKEVEDIKIKKKRLEDEYHLTLPRHAQQQQKLRACEVCGAFLSMYDNDRRLADHFGGKLHMGFVSIREKITLLEERIKEKRERRIREREEREKERKSGRSRSRERERQRDSRDDGRRRSRSRDRKDRDRDRDYDRRSRRRSRSRSPRDRSYGDKRRSGNDRSYRDRDSRRSRSRERHQRREDGEKRRSRSRSH